MFRVLTYKAPYTPTNIRKNKSQLKLVSTDESKAVSVRRTRRLIHDYAKCNDFDLFVTFTFNPKKVDRYDLNQTYLKMQGWLWRQHQKDHNFKYVIVPEKHHDGAIHFHAIMKDYPFELKKTSVIQNNLRVYNITAFRFGFTNATMIKDDKDSNKIANYISKYITKDMIMIHNRRRYWCSRNLQKPKKYYNSIYDLDLANKLDHKSLVTETEFNNLYEVQKELFA